LPAQPAPSPARCVRPTTDSISFSSQLSIHSRRALRADAHLHPEETLLRQRAVVRALAARHADALALRAEREAGHSGRPFDVRAIRIHFAWRCAGVRLVPA